MRILIATVTAGAGHRQAAAAREEAWRTALPSNTLEHVDVLDFVSKLSRKLHSEGYVKVIDHAPELYAHLFKKTDSPALMRKLSRVRRIFIGDVTDEDAKAPRYGATFKEVSPEKWCVFREPREIRTEVK